MGALQIYIDDDDDDDDEGQMGARGKKGGGKNEMGKGRTP